MNALDTTPLVYAHREHSPFHVAALGCLTACAKWRAAWGLPWPCVHEFYDIVPHPRIYSPPKPPELALDQIDAGWRGP